MTKKIFSINYTNGTIDGSANAFKKAGVYGSFEYKELHKIMKDNPSLIPNEVKRPIKEGKKTYSGLNFNKMREYISTQPNAELNLSKFEEVIKIAKAKRATYAYTKLWFFEQFPEYKESAIVVQNSEAKALSESENKNLVVELNELGLTA